MNDTSKLDSFDVLLLMGVPDEYEHALSFITPDVGQAWHPLRGRDKIPMVWGEFTSASAPSMTVLVSRSYDMGEDAATERIRDLHDTFQFRGVAMSGVCAGRKGKVRQGDVIVASKLWRTGPGKITTSYSNKIPLVTEEANVESQSVFPRYWREELFDFRRSFLSRFSDQIMALYPQSGEPLYRPSVHVGLLRTVRDVTLDHEAFPKANKLKRPTIGIEMEGMAVAKTAESLGLDFWLVAKGVQDFAMAQLGGSDKDNDDIYRPLAASASALFVIQFLREHLPAIATPTGGASSSQSVGLSLPFDTNEHFQLLARQNRDSVPALRISNIHPQYADGDWIRRAFGTAGLKINVERVQNDVVVDRFPFVTDLRRRVFLPLPKAQDGRQTVSDLHNSIALRLNSHQVNLYLTYLAQAGIEVE